MSHQAEQAAVFSQEVDLRSMNISSTAATVRDSDGKGKGVFTSRALAKGEVAIVGKPVAIAPERNARSVQIDVDTHVMMDAPFEYSNHSCEPNCGIRANRYKGYDLIALREIAAGEEITWDYCSTEWVCVGFEDCCCDSEQCRKLIRGAKFLAPETLRSYGLHAAPYFRVLLRDTPPWMTQPIPTLA